MEAFRIVFYPLPTDAHVSFHTHKCMHKHTLISQPIPLSRRSGVPAVGASRWMMYVSYIVWMTHKVVNTGVKKKGAVACVAAAVWFPGLHCTADMLEYCKGCQDLCHKHIEVTLKDDGDMDREQVLTTRGVGATIQSYMNALKFYVHVCAAPASIELKH